MWKAGAEDVCGKCVCVLFSKEKLNEPSTSTHAFCCRTAHGLPVEVSVRGVGCVVAAHCAAVGCGWEGVGLIVDRGNQWEVGGRDLLRGCCQLVGPWVHWLLYTRCTWVKLEKCWALRSATTACYQEFKSIKLQDNQKETGENSTFLLFLFKHNKKRIKIHLFEQPPPIPLLNYTRTLQAWQSRRGRCLWPRLWP